MKTGKFVITAACFGAALSMASAQQAPVQEPRDTRVAWKDRCPSEPEKTSSENNKSLLIGGLLAAVAPKLIEGAVDAAAESLKAAGKPKDIVTTARSSHDFYKISENADLILTTSCLVIVRGVFTNTSGTPLPEFGWTTGTGLTDLQKVVFQLEAKVRPLRSAKFFRLEPIFLKVNDFEEFSFFDPTDRDYLVAVSLTLPGGSQPFGSAEFLFKDIARMDELKLGHPKLRTAMSLSVALPAESSDATKAKANLEGHLAPWLLAADILTPVDPPIVKAPSLYDGTNLARTAEAFCNALQVHNKVTPRAFEVNDERCAYTLEAPRAALEFAASDAYRSPARRAWAAGLCTYIAPDPVKQMGPKCGNIDEDVPLAKLRAGLASKQFTHVTTQLTLKETREGSKLALLLGNALSSAKADVSTVLKDKLIPKTQAQLDAENSATRLAANAATVADIEVTKAEEQLAELLSQENPKNSELTAARIALLKAKIASNSARRAAKLPVLFTEVQ